MIQGICPGEVPAGEWLWVHEVCCHYELHFIRFVQILVVFFPMEKKDKELDFIFFLLYGTEKNFNSKIFLMKKFDPWCDV